MEGFDGSDNNGSLVIHMNAAALEHVQKGLELIQNGKIDEAGEEFQTALKIEPGTSEAQFGMGMVYQQKGMLAEAEEHYKTAVKLDPTNTDALFNIGSISMFRRDFNQAISIYQLLSEMTPEDPQVFLNLGSVLIESGQPEKAIAPLEEALRLDPNYANAKILMARVKQQGR
jgi:Tfp pilus assembly protein PilF